MVVRGEVHTRPRHRLTHCLMGTSESPTTNKHKQTNKPVSLRVLRVGGASDGSGGASN